jgi:hypothetical protein
VLLAGAILHVNVFVHGEAKARGLLVGALVEGAEKGVELSLRARHLVSFTGGEARGKHGRKLGHLPLVGKDDSLRDVLEGGVWYM